MFNFKFIDMTKIDYSQLIIKRLIIHDVPKHKKNECGSPRYSENESTITDGLRLFFQDKVKSALNSDQAFKVKIKEETESSVPLSISNIIKSEECFINESKVIAENLFNFQKGNNSAGILLIITGVIINKQVCVILKLERDNGAQLVLNNETNTFNVEEVKNLMLTSKTKIFKVALIVLRNDFSVDYDGILMDYQINIKNKKGTDTFFLDFMGCYPYKDSKIATKYFYNYTKDFINQIQDVLMRAKYAQDLNSYLLMNQNTISPKEFADNYMKDTEHKNQYQKYLSEKGFAFETYTKDNTLIKSHIAKIMLQFENGISILGAKGSLNENVNLTFDKKTDICTATISSKIKEIK